MVTSTQTRIWPPSYFPAASVDPTEARNDILGCFGRSHRSRIGQDVAVHAGFKSFRPDLMGQETPQPLGRRAFFACFLVFFTTGIAVQIRGVLGNVFFSVRRNSLSQLTFSRFN
jgi:hypothetical protein